MKYPQRIGAFVALAAAMTVPGALLRAQTAPAAAEPARSDAASPESGDQELVILSPFEVTATKGGSYSAATTLAGNRLNTELRDVGSAISVVTEQFMKDIGATSNETLLQYTNNTEVGNIYGNFTNAGSGTQLDETSKFASPNSNTRVRGLAAADNTRDFFLSDIPWDSYNTDRVDMQRGPNAILFGLGSPAGIINAGLKTAGFKNRGEIALRYGSFGSTRSSLDVNQVLIDNELALRLDALWDNQKFQQKPAYQRDRRIYGALRYEPGFLNKGSAHTTIKANMEFGKIDSNRPRTLTPGDAITPWFLTGTANGFTATGAPLVYNNPNRQGFSAIGLQDQGIASLGLSTMGQQVKTYSNGTINPYWQPWLGGQLAAGGYDNPLAIFDSGASPALRYVAGTPTTSRGLRPAGTIDGSIGGIPFSRMSSMTIYRDISKKVNLPGAKFGLTRNLQLSDSSVFDFYNNLIDGPNKKEWQNFRSFDVSLAQTFLHGDLGGEITYDQQHFDNGQLVFMTDKGQALYVDVIQTLADGSTNPNFGRPFIADGMGNNNSRSTDRESLRATVFAQHDFAAHGDRSFVARLLGKQVITGLFSSDEVKSDSRGWMRYGTDLAYKDFVSSPTSVQTIESSLRSIYPVVYLGGSLASATTASGANIPRPTALAVAKTGSIRTFDSTWTATDVSPAAPWINPYYPTGTSTQSENPANYRGWVDIPLNVIDSEDGNRDVLTKSAQLTKSTVNSQAVVWQGYFWDRAIVGMFGYRQDDAKAWSKQGVRNNLNQVNLDPASYALPTVYGQRLQEQSTSWSVVAHLSQFFGDRLPFQLSAFYNKSENFQPLAGRVDPLNHALAAPAGSTKDVGILIGTKDGRYSLKINRYVSTVINASGSGINAFYLGGLIGNGQNWANIYEYNLGGSGYTMDYANTGDPGRYTYAPGLGQTQAQADAEEAAAIAGWKALVASLPEDFPKAWGMDLSKVRQHSAVSPIGMAQPEDDTSRGYEFELFAEPIKNLRLTINAAKSDATRKNVGGAVMSQLAETINTALNTTAAGDIRLNWGSATSTTTLQDWNASFWATWTSMKVQEGSAAPEVRKWRFNIVANYDFTTGFLKGVNVGAGYRWQDKVVLGYKPLYYKGTQVLADDDAAGAAAATGVGYDLDRPYYGPSENNIDVWVGYSHKLTEKIDWRVQLNVRNLGKGNGLIPITVQADGTPASYRIAPTQVWSLTNTFSF